MRLLACLAFLAVTAGMLPAQDDEPDKRLRNATDTLREIMSTPDKAIPRGLLNRSRCLAIVPGMKKAASSSAGNMGAAMPSAARSGVGARPLPSGWRVAAWDCNWAPIPPTLFFW